jgi:hypothetical protein
MSLNLLSKKTLWSQVLAVLILCFKIFIAQETFSSITVVSTSLLTIITSMSAIITSKKASILYPKIQLEYIFEKYSTPDAKRGVTREPTFSENQKSQIIFQKSFCLQHIFKFSSKKACHVPLKNEKHNHQKKDAIRNQI